jgi:hypothetical protein
MAAFAGIYLLLAIFVLVLGLLWLLVPFLIMGTNSRLTKIIEQNERLLARQGIERPDSPIEKLAEKVYGDGSGTGL